MAIRNNETHAGIVVKNAYIKIERITVINGEPMMELAVLFRAGKEYEPFKGECYVAPYDAGSPGCFEQAYQYLKTLPEFEGAEDC